MKKISKIVLVLFLFFLNACTLEETPKEASENAIMAFKKLDMEILEQYFGSLNEFIDPATQKFHPATIELVKYLEFEILESEGNEREAIVKTEITNLNMEPIRDVYFDQLINYPFEDGITDEEMKSLQDNLLVTSIQESDKETFTSFVDIYLRKVDGSWKIQQSEALMDALLGRAEYSYE